LSTGIITTAIVLIVGYVIISRIIGLAFRLIVPLVLIAIPAGTGLFSGFMPDRAPERYPVDQGAPYGQARLPPEADSGGVGDIRLREVADLAVDAVRLVLQRSLAFLNGVSNAESGMHSRPPADPRNTPRGQPHQVPFDFYDDSPPRDTLRGP
jgi:hypothetical protein